MKQLFFIILLLSIMVSCKTPKKDVTNESFISFFNSFNPQWRQAIKTNNPAYILDRYVDDAIIGPPNKQFIIGIESIKTHWENIVGYMDDFGYETQRIGGNKNDVFYESGIAFAEYKFNNQVQRDTTKYLFVWKKLSGNNYKILAEMFNSLPKK